MKVFLLFVIVGLAPMVFAQPKAKVKGKPLVTATTCASIYRLASLSPAAVLDPLSDDRELQYCLASYQWRPGQRDLIKRVEQNLSDYIRTNNLDKQSVVVREQ